MKRSHARAGRVLAAADLAVIAGRTASRDAAVGPMPAAAAPAEGVGPVVEAGEEVYGGPDYPMSRLDRLEQAPFLFAVKQPGIFGGEGAHRRADQKEGKP